MKCPLPDCNFKALDDLQMSDHIKDKHYWDDVNEIIELLIGLAKSKYEKLQGHYRVPIFDPKKEKKGKKK